ncbi:RNA recognition motif. family protein [Cryptosporidium muris RN66]|uniref:RNA recognition motif. family protein n=1 Tax=Cryptosporidium muris (strain RN66) TaxID=441375 RepID=B6AJ22_CRYMR|nr:RNA recognition motif. family protein [Cryptosporidium muris RN66]EEA08213.1 RNA recognition motif. family protein [Cryptosporidium muris RN66]|eukprot:XP_002142562.1 RNA recognition motif. family protein [Cryptosporidium muris RN66]
MKKSKKKYSKDTENLVKNTSIYVTGLPRDITIEEVRNFFTRCGIIKIDPSTLEPKIKLYKDKETNELKGDALVSYKFQESVELALKYLDQTEIRCGYSVKIQKAIFNVNHSQYNKPEDKNLLDIHKKQLIAAKLEEQRLMSWSNEEVIGISQGKSLNTRIVVLRHMYSKQDAEKFNEDDLFYKELEDEIYEEVSKFGTVINVTSIPRHPHGIVCVKFKKSEDAEIAVSYLNNRFFDGRQIEAFLYDGKTDFKVSTLPSRKD